MTRQEQGHALAWLRGLAAAAAVLACACAPRLVDLPDRPPPPPSPLAGDEAVAAETSRLREAFLQRGDVAPGHQPIEPGFVPHATRNAAIAFVLTASDMGARPYDLEQVYARLDPAMRTSVGRLRAIGLHADVEFRELLAALARGLGTQVVPIGRFLDEVRHDGRLMVISAPVKGERRIVEKALTSYGGDISLVQDLVRGSVALDHPDDVKGLADRVLALLDMRGIEIVEMEDRFATPMSGGYRDFQVNLRLPRSRVIGELQFHLKDLLIVKQRVGHAVYERARLACAALGMGIDLPGLADVCARNDSQVAARYERAYRRAFSRPRMSPPARSGAYAPPNGRRPGQGSFTLNVRSACQVSSKSETSPLVVSLPLTSPSAHVKPSVLSLPKLALMWAARSPLVSFSVSTMVTAGWSLKSSWLAATAWASRAS